MSTPLQIDNAKLTPYHLIVEEIFDESVFGMVAPSAKIAGLKVIGTKHSQVLRNVYTIAHGEDVYFKGKRMQSAPGAREFLSELFEPGQQLTTRPNGKTMIVHTYMGKKNIFTAKALEKYSKSVTIFSPAFGKDPAPTRLLQGNPNATFVQQGDQRPMAAAYFNAANNRLEMLHYFERRTLLDDFLKHFAEPSLAAVG